MKEYTTSLILDGASYKVSWSKNGRQNKITIGNEKRITVLAARKVCSEVDDLLNTDFSIDSMRKLYAINLDAQKCGYREGLLKYQNLSIEIAVRIKYPDDYEKFVSDDEYCQIRFADKALEILNMGCTGAGKTRYILGATLPKNALKNFIPALTSLRETTSCSIIYHINNISVALPDDTHFKVSIWLKSEEEIESSVKSLIQETVEEYIVTIKDDCKFVQDIIELTKKCRGNVEKRLEMNYDKTFGLGLRPNNRELASKIEKLTISILMEYYCNSKSIDKLASEDKYFIIKQLARDFENEQLDISSDEINQMVVNSDLQEIIKEITSILLQDLYKFNSEYSQSVDVGDEITHEGNIFESDTLMFLSHVFGNKVMQRKQDSFYTIEPIIKNADFFFRKKLPFGREIILSDSVGINQGQKDAARINEVVFNRVQESVQNRRPDIILYHTKINNKDDYMLDIIKKLKAQGYTQSVYVVSGRLDEVWKEYADNNDLEDDMVDEITFNEFIDETRQIYVDSDSVTLNSIIGDRYYLCDKTNSISNKFTFANDFTCLAVLENIINDNLRSKKKANKFDDVDFMSIIKKYGIPGSVYQKFIDSIPQMIPLDYSKMRWNTLQKAIEELRYNGYGFDILYPAFKIKNAISNEINREEVKNEFEMAFGESSEELKKKYLLEVGEVAQIVLVTEYRTIMKLLLDMRSDSSLRTNLCLTMTDDRKQNLHRLYERSMLQNGTQGAYAVQMILHIAWIRTLDFFEKMS